MPQPKLALLGLPSVVREFSGLKTVTRTYRVQGLAIVDGNMPTELWLEFGTPDIEHEEALLTAQRVERVDNNPNTDHAFLIRVYQEFTDNQLVNVGDDVVTRDSSGRESLQQTSVCLAEDAETLAPAIGTVVGDKAVANVSIQKNGVGARVIVTLISAGRLSESTQTRYNGKLILKTLVYFNEVPPTPTGFMLVDTSVQNPDGVPTYTYQFAQGSGEISRSIDYQQSTDQGATGITRVVIRHLTGPEVDSDPTSLEGFIKIGQDMAEQDGHRLWTISYAKGIGLVIDEVETRNNGALIIYRRAALGAAPTAPAPTIGGSVVQFSTAVRTDSGFTVHDYRWAEGVGEISRSTETRYNGKLVLISITHLTAPDTNAQPTTAPEAGYILVSTDKQEEEGYRLWRVRWGKGDGIISADTSRSHKGKLINYRIVKLSPSDAPVPPVAPAGTIGGIVTLVDSNAREEDGHVLYSYRWAEGFGIISQTVQPRGNGLRTQTYVSLGMKQTPSGVVIAEDQDEIDGVTRYTVTSMQNAAGNSPTMGALTFEKFVPFVYPGRAKAYSRTVSGSSRRLADVFLSPPVETEVKATIEISYTTSNTVSSTGRWQPKEWATVEAKFLTNKGRPLDIIKGLRGYRTTSSSTVSVSMPTFPDSDSPGGTIMGYNVYGGTTGTLRVIGGPENPDGKTYVLDAAIEPAFQGVDGTQYYRKTVVTATIPAQPGLPV
ncbi:MAG TPA: hypothetical protein VHF69_10095 [Candidatus Synoicihabitans sp.]|nr:hypothetical protein [Candidatus Synoicihabitans sp.]